MRNHLFLHGREIDSTLGSCWYSSVHSHRKCKKENERKQTIPPFHTDRGFDSNYYYGCLFGTLLQWLSSSYPALLGLLFGLCCIASHSSTNLTILTQLFVQAEYRMKVCVAECHFLAYCVSARSTVTLWETHKCSLFARLVCVGVCWCVLVCVGVFWCVLVAYISCSVLLNG